MDAGACDGDPLSRRFIRHIDHIRFARIIDMAQFFCHVLDLVNFTMLNAILVLTIMPQSDNVIIGSWPIKRQLPHLQKNSA